MQSQFPRARTFHRSRRGQRAVIQGSDADGAKSLLSAANAHGRRGVRHTDRKSGQVHDLIRNISKQFPVVASVRHLCVSLCASSHEHHDAERLSDAAKSLPGAANVSGE